MSDPAVGNHASLVEASRGGAPAVGLDRRTILIAAVVFAVYLSASVSLRKNDGEVHDAPLQANRAREQPQAATTQLPAVAAAPATAKAPAQPLAAAGPANGPVNGRPAVLPTDRLASNDAVMLRDWHRLVNTTVQPMEAVRVFADHWKRCAATNGASERTTAALRWVIPQPTIALDGPGWVRLWIESLDSTNASTCRGGDAVEASAESESYRPVVDRPLDLGNGLHEVRFIARRGGEYTVCADWTISFGAAAASVAAERGPRVATVNDAFYDGLPTTRLDRPIDKAELPHPETQPQCTVGRSWRAATCSTVKVTIAAAGQQRFDAAITVQRKRSGGKRCTHPMAFRSGAWVKMPRASCDGDACAGDLSSLTSGGWVWASDFCTVTIHDPDMAWGVVRGRWLAAWGDSTLKQPVANFIEYNLRVPVFHASMERLESLPRKGRPGFFTYRQYEVSRPRPASPNGHEIVLDADAPAASPASDGITVSMSWGGCPNVGAPPGCPDSGMKNRRHLQSVLERHAKQSQVPDVVLLNHFIWRPRLFSESALLAEMHDTIAWLHSTIRGIMKESGIADSKMPLFVWMTATRPIVSDMRGPYCSAEDFTAFVAHATLLIEHELSTKYAFVADPAARATLDRPSVMIMSRFALTQPYHYDDRYCHFGVHYGATRGMCMTGISYKDGYNLGRCLRDTLPDNMLLQLWLNGIAAGTAAAAG